MKELPLKEFAELVGVPYTTMMDWVKAGRVEGARFQEAPTPTGGYWLVPESAANKLKRPKKGRPRKAAGAKASKKRK